jgi:hypothetical protein
LFFKGVQSTVNSVRQVEIPETVPQSRPKQQPAFTIHLCSSDCELVKLHADIANEEAARGEKQWFVAFQQSD